MLVFAESAALPAARSGLASGGEAASAMMLERTVSLARRSRSGDVHLFLRGSSKTTEASQCADGLFLHSQRGSCFAERLENAIASVRSLGYDRAVIIGTDTPALRSSHVRAAVAGLSAAPLSLGQDRHGGCWIIGLRLGDSELRSGGTWERNVDFDQLLQRCPQAVVLRQRMVDLDSMADVLASLASGTSRVRAMFAAWMLTALGGKHLELLGGRRAVDQERCRRQRVWDRQSWQLPPPLAA